MRKFRIVQVAPLTHRDAYRIQEYKEVIDYSAALIKEFDSSTLHMVGDNVDIAKARGLPTKFDWITINTSSFNDYGRYNSFYDAYSWIKGEQDRQESKRIERDELDAFQKAAHGKEVVIANYEF